MKKFAVIARMALAAIVLALGIIPCQAQLSTVGYSPAPITQAILTTLIRNPTYAWSGANNEQRARLRDMAFVDTSVYDRTELASLVATDTAQAQKFCDEAGILNCQAIEAGGLAILGKVSIATRWRRPAASISMQFPGGVKAGIQVTQDFNVLEQKGALFVKIQGAREGEVVFIVPYQGDTPEAARAAMQRPLQSGAIARNEYDAVRLPVITFDTTERINELDGTRLIDQQRGSNIGTVRQLVQRTMFTMNEAGATQTTKAQRARIVGVPQKPFMVLGPFCLIMLRTNGAGKQQPVFMGLFPS